MKSLFLLLILLLPMQALAQDTAVPNGEEAAPAPAPATQTTFTDPIMAFPASVPLGDPFLVRLTSDSPVSEVVIHWEGKNVVPSISVWNDKHVALAMLGTDVLSDKSGRRDLVISVTEGGKSHEYKHTVMVTEKDFKTQKLTLPPKMVTPPQEVLDRIARERKVIAKARNLYSPERFWNLPFFRPVGGIVLSPYGARRILNGKPRNPHRGLDFRSPMGNPIKSLADGVVALVGDHYYAGKSVYVDHGNGVISMYFHMSKPTVKEGERVKRGQTLGLTGSTGRATGPHLHLSVSVQGKLVNPAPLFENDTDAMLGR